MRKALVCLFCISFTAAIAAPAAIRLFSVEKDGYITVPPVLKTEEEWKKQLTPEQYQVTRKQGTEIAFTGKFWNNHTAGIYRCVACGTDLFSSETKFESGTGWPSFWKPIAPENVLRQTDL